MATRTLDIPSSNGTMLAARIELPADDRAAAWAVFAHCFTCSKDSRAAVDISRALARLGWGVVRFDFTGLGDSGGDHAETGFASNVDDVLAVARHMEAELEAPSMLIGHSLGGAAVLAAAGSLDSVGAVVTIGAPASPAHVLRHVAASAADVAASRDGEVDVEIGGRRVRLGRAFFEELGMERMEERVGDMRKALLLLHSPTDEVVGIENAAKLYEMARHPKSFVSLDGADHLLRRRTDSVYVAGVVAAWADRYIVRSTEAEEIEQLRDSDRAVTRTERGTFLTDVVVRHHTLLADEPVSVGGQDAGPTPYDYLLAALGSCTSMTLQMYAGRKEWPLEEAVVRLRHRKVHAADCEHCDEDDVRLDEVDREVELIGPLAPEQRTRLMEIADRCPVHRTLEAGIRVRTTERET